MPDPNKLGELATRLEETVRSLPRKPANANELWEAYEEISIQVLDSQHGDFIPGELQEYLETFLYSKRLELGLVPFPDPREE